MRELFPVARGVLDRRGGRDRLILTDPAMDRKLTETLRDFASQRTKRGHAIRASQERILTLLAENGTRGMK